LSARYLAFMPVHWDPPLSMGKTYRDGRCSRRWAQALRPHQRAGTLRTGVLPCHGRVPPTWVRVCFSLCVIGIGGGPGPDLEGSWSYVVLVVVSEGLLVASRPNRRSAPYFLKVEDVVLPQLILIFLVVGSHPRASQRYFGWEHGFGSIDEKEWCLACRVAWGGSVCPYHC
jgi:hypothetical protein